MVDNPRLPGNQPVSQEEIDTYVRQLEPFLKAGLSIRKACQLSKVPKSSVYDLLEYNLDFADKIEGFMLYQPALLSTIISYELHTIRGKQENGVPLDKQDRSFVQWYACHAVVNKEEFGKEEELPSYDPEKEIRRIMRLIDEKCDEVTFTPEETGIPDET